jgi:hypothetical protein
MPDLSFSQAERRNFTLPTLIAFVVLAIVAGVLLLRTPLRAADLAVTHAATLPTHSVYVTDTKLVGVPDAAVDAFYVVATVHIHNRLHVPLFIDDITSALTAPDGSVLTTSAAEKSDLPNLFISFPKLKPLASSPLLRESTIPPGSDAEGMVVFSYPITAEAWAGRKSAAVTVRFYHQGEFTADIPKP